MFSFEIDILRAIEGIRCDFLTSFFETVTMLGEETLLVLFMTVIYFVFDKKLAQRVFFITVASLSVNGIIKNFVKLPRPWISGDITCVRPDTATGYSFPSGHTQNVTTWSAAFAIKLKKSWMYILSSVFSLLVAFSRLYLGAHYPSDIAAGLVLGILIAFAGSVLYEKTENKNLLYGIVTLLFTPFAILFLCDADLQYADFYKLYGLFSGFFLAVMFEEKYVGLDCNQNVWKKILRVVVGITVALAIKEGLKTAFGTLDVSSVALLLVFDFVRYFAIAVVELGVCPYVFKKVNL